MMQMEYISKTTDISIHQPTVITIGKFDGFHRGHQTLLEIAHAKKKAGLQVVVFTFDIPPRTIAADESTPVLTTNAEKQQIFTQSGVDYLIEYPFTKQVKNLKPEEFVHRIVAMFTVKCIVLGADFRFGRERSGDYQTLQQCGIKYGFEVVVVEKMEHMDDVISSTRIRAAILKGNLEETNFLLGYEYFVKGTVVLGNQIGRTLGMPTVNIIPEREKLLPPFGVYITKVKVAGKCYHGISNLGRKPTIQGEHPIGIETHIFNFNQDIYGQEIDILFIHFLRSEQKFDNLDKLKEQMWKDMEDAKKYYTNVTKCVDSVKNG
jgi:riboflavin kinase/FMN adenylyltransferase